MKPKQLYGLRYKNTNMAW